jgi:ethanolamine kinase
MSPQEFIRARQQAAQVAHSDATTTTLCFMVQERPYFPLYTIDAAKDDSIAQAARLCLDKMMEENSLPSKDSENATATDNSNNNNNNNNNDTHSVQVTRISGGVTNQLYRVQGLSQPCLVRIFGAEGLIDRDVDTSTFAALDRADGLGPPYLGRLANGRVEGWLDDMRTLEPRDLAHPDIAHQIAQALAHLHTHFAVPAWYEGVAPNVWTQLEDWYQQVLQHTNYQTEADHQRVQALEVASLSDELAWLQQTCPVESARVSFCHNDLLAANILYHDTTHQLQLIDFEYGGMNYASFDLANHFNEYASGPPITGTPNYDWLPSLKAQRSFVRTYLHHTTLSANHNHDNKDEDETNITEAQVDTMVHEIQAFMMVNHLYWGLWAIHQAYLEGCDDYDYLQFAASRIRQYYVCKHEWLQETSKDVTLLEQS